MTDLVEFDVVGDASARAQLRAEVASDLVASSYLRGDFTLSSGEQSSFYFDKYLFETKPTILRRVADMLASQVPPDVERLAATEGGGVALAAAVSLATGLPFVIIRRSAEAGAPAVRGELHPGERVVLVEDVIGLGNQAVTSLTRLKELKALVVAVVAVIDREDGGRTRIEGAGSRYLPLYSLSELGV